MNFMRDNNSTSAFLLQTAFGVVNYVNDSIPRYRRFERLCNNTIIQPNVLEIDVAKICFKYFPNERKFILL